MFLDLQAYLGARHTEIFSRTVGDPLDVALDPAKYSPQVRFLAPQDAGMPSATIDAVAGADKMLHARLVETDASGYYEAMLTRSDSPGDENKPDIRRYAYNVEPAEGDLSALDQSQLAERLKGVKYQFEKAEAFQAATNESTGDNLRDAILYLLVLMLVGEQLLAYSASYHPTAPKNLVQAGGIR
jgi:hypothetical protein